MAAKDGLVIYLNLDKVPLRDESMSPEEIMLSESQERMLIVLRSGHEKKAKEIFQKWDLNIAKIGKITNSNNIKIKYRGKKITDIPLEPLVDGIIYKRKYIIKKNKKIKTRIISSDSIKRILLKIIKSPNYSSKNWIWEQYDHMISANVLSPMGGDASVINIEKTKMALAITTDCNIEYCKKDSYLGTIQAIAESYRNLRSVGSIPLAITNCLNFGNPQNQVVMGQFVECIRGIKDASETLKMPVVSGNVSFYNETNGQNIPPTPQIGAIGIIKNTSKTINLIPCPNEIIFMLGSTKGQIGCSAYSMVNSDKNIYAVPPITNLNEEYNIGCDIHSLIQKSIISACHDISDGGLILALAEMCILSNLGCDLTKTSKNHNFLFSEDQSRYLISVSVSKLPLLYNFLKLKNIKHKRIGKMSLNNINAMLKFPDKSYITVKQLRNKHSKWFENYMSNTK